MSQYLKSGPSNVQGCGWPHKPDLIKMDLHMEERSNSAHHMRATDATAFRHGMVVKNPDVWSGKQSVCGISSRLGSWSPGTFGGFLFNSTGAGDCCGILSMCMRVFCQLR